MPYISNLPKEASKLINASYTKEDDYYKMSIHGRARSVLGNSQGGHVTAYRLIEEGLYRALSELKNSEVEELHHLQNRNSLRDKRFKLYNFISAVSALIEKPEEDAKFDSKFFQDYKIFQSKFNALLEKYNDQRFKKTEIRNRRYELQSDQSLTEDNFKNISKEIEGRYKTNGQLMREFFIEATRLLLTVYNKIPKSSFFEVEGFGSKAGEGSRVREAIKSIKNNIEKCYAIKDNSAALQVKLSNNIVPALLELIHYPEITEFQKIKNGTRITKKTSELLVANLIKTENYGSSLAKPRNNSNEDLVKILARHIHIAVAIYPELTEIFDCSELINDFVSKFVTRKEFGWPSYNNQHKINNLAKEVDTEFNRLQLLSLERNYINFSQSLASSDDEDEISSSSFRNPSSAATKPLAVLVTKNISERDELIELRKFKEIIEKEIDIPPQILLKIKECCPILSSQAAKEAVSGR